MATTPKSQQLRDNSNLPIKDQSFYRIVAWALSIVVILTIVGGLWLASDGKDIPAAIIALDSTAVGALVGVLAGTKLG